MRTWNNDFSWGFATSRNGVWFEKLKGETHYWLILCGFNFMFFRNE